jgi:hypothetical protein
MPQLFPHFESAFIDRLSRQFEKRCKAISYFGKLGFETKQPDDFDWLTIKFYSFGGHYLILQFVEDNRLSLFVRSSRRRDRGKILLALEDIILIDNSKLIVEAFESTARKVRDGAQPFELSTAPEEICDKWTGVRVSVSDG